MIDICNLCKNLCTDNFFDSLSFSEMLIFLKNSVAEKVDVGNFLQKLGYSCGDLENFLYRMIFFENEDFEFAMQRALCLSLLGLRRLGWTREDEKNYSLSYAMDDICDFFAYFPDGSVDLVYYMYFLYDSRRKYTDNDNSNWTPSFALERHLDDHREYLDPWNEVKLDKCQELFNNKFALIRNGKYRHHLIAGERKDDNGMSLRIWTDKIFTREKEYKFNFRSDEELKKFLVDNGMVFDSFISNDFFLDEKSYILNFREGFDSQDLFTTRFSYVEPFKETGDCDPYFGLL